jgi:colanic acid biosynthesis glycosyl transferase WcaI
MKILFYGLNYAPELVGVGKYTTECAEWLAAQGHQPVVITALPHFPHWRVLPGFAEGGRSEQREGVQVYRCPIWLPRRLSTGKRVLCCLSWVLGSLPRLWAEARQHPDLLVVIEPTIFALPAALLVGALAGVPVWIHVQDFELNAAQGAGMIGASGLARLASRVEGWLLRKAHRVSTLTRRMEVQLDLYRVPADQKVLFPNWCDCRKVYPLPAASPFRAQLRIGASDIVLMFSGSFGKKHGLEVLIEVARALQEHPDYRLVLCGDGPEREALQAASAELGNIVWLPIQPIEKLNELLNLADIHLIPQRPNVADAVFPSKLTNCLASGRPVIATAAEGTEMGKIASEAGIVTVPADAQSYIQAILALGADQPRRSRLGAQARRYAETQLDREQVLGNFNAALYAALPERLQPA